MPNLRTANTRRKRAARRDRDRAWLERIFGRWGYRAERDNLLHHLELQRAFRRLAPRAGMTLLELGATLHQALLEGEWEALPDAMIDGYALDLKTGQ